MEGIVPEPVRVRPAPGAAYTITPETRIYTEPGSAEAAGVGEYLAGLLRPPTGYDLPVAAANGSGTPGGISLLLSGAGADLGEEGYRLAVTDSAVTVRAHQPPGLFRAVQTLRQLLPGAVEAGTTQEGPWLVPGGHIVDYPRFGYRGAMLDVARHFFTVAELERYIDLISLYKINRLHLHLSDDQGWRIAIGRWPRLAAHGGGTEVGGGPGGYYTAAEYRRIVAYAAARSITVVPEIDMPGHTNAALASYARLNCGGRAPPRYTGTEVGFSSLCVGKEVTYEFVDDVVGELAALTPGPYLHIGGEEADPLSASDYVTFVNRAQRMVAGHGKRVMGWHQIARAEPVPGRVVQYWGTSSEARQVARAARHGTALVLSPAARAYLDMGYPNGSRSGLDSGWAGPISVADAYGWDPGSYLGAVRAADVLGVEAVVWSETLEDMRDVEYMTFPRLPAIAELGWSPAGTRGWDGFRRRLAEHGPRWEVLGVDFHRSPQVPWPS